MNKVLYKQQGNNRDESNRWR